MCQNDIRAGLLNVEKALLEEASLLAPLPNETKPRWLASQAAIEFWLLYRSPVDSSKKKMAEKKEIHW